MCRPTLLAIVFILIVACGSSSTEKTTQALVQTNTASGVVGDTSKASPIPSNTATAIPTAAPTLTRTSTPTPSPTPTPPPTPQPVARATFAVNSQPVGCHQAPNADAPIVAQLVPGTVQEMDQIVRQPDGTWHREVDRQCWTRTDPGPVRMFGALPDAEGYAATLRPIVLQGVGQTATREIKPPSSVSVVAFTHSGRSNFIVHAFHGDKEDYLVNKIGVYQGARPLFGTEPVTFDIRADGAWTLRIEPVARTDTPVFSGKGDAVSGLFDPPSTGAWEIMHDGRANFIVHLYCAGGTEYVQNEIGRVAGSRVVRFPKGPCMWEVEADGNWSLKPRQ
jgi:hypothetical protein